MLKENTIADVREELKCKYRNGLFHNNTVELQCVSFMVTEDTIIGTPNEDYINAEMRWYYEQSFSVDRLAEIYGKRVKIWDDVADNNGYIHSNYGWCIYSARNGYQYKNVRDKLKKDPYSRQAIMIYNRPSMHFEAELNGMKDFMCTTHVQYMITDNKLNAYVYMRSNDAVFGFINDHAWQAHVLFQLANDLEVEKGYIKWNAGSLHVYPRHYHLLEA